MPDMDGFYLTLRNIPVYPKKLRHIKNQAYLTRNFLRLKYDINNEFFEIDTDCEDLIRRLNSGVIVAKYYDRNNIPSHEKLVDDLHIFLNMYKFVLNNEIDREILYHEWISVFKNDIFNSQMIELLNIIYNSDDHSITMPNFLDKIKNLDISNEKEFKKLVATNSNMVEKFLDRKPIYDEKRRKINFIRFFHVRNLMNGYTLTLREELVKAIENLQKENKVGVMAEKEIYNSFFDYLLEKEYVFDKEIIENYLLSLKVKPFVILTGNSGTGKTKLSQLFSQYIADKGADLDSEDFEEEKDISDNSSVILEEDEAEFVNVKVTTQKSSWSIFIDGREQNPGWTISNKCFLSYLPIDQIMGDYEIEIDGIKGTASLKPVIQVYYDKKNRKFKKEFEKLYLSEKENKEIEKIAGKKHKKQFVNLDINKNSIQSLLNKNEDSFNDSVSLSLPITKTAIEKRQWLISYEIFNYLPFNKSRANCKLRYNDVFAEGHIEIKFRLSYSKNDEISDYLRDNQNKKENVELIIKDLKWDLNDFKPSWGNIVELKGNKNISSSDNSVQLDMNEFYDEEAELYDDEVVVIKEENYKIIPVGANWTENRNIVGFFNVITNKYNKTPALNLIEQANKSQKPYFLILDEMNLSHVERYFADFLSAIESGEKIPLYGEKELTLPSNLFIIGTVNVDETTYMFSPKVLDRANVLEFKTYSASDYMNKKIDITSPSGNITYLEDPLLGSYVRDYRIDELRDLFKNVVVDEEPFWDILSNEIEFFQAMLKKSGFDFGFRVINEIVRFMAVAWEYEGKPTEFTNWSRYFDACIKQKMLPKLHGSEKVIGETLNKLYNACSDSVIGTEDMVKYPESYKKLDEMRTILRKQRYVSFIN